MINQVRNVFSYWIEDFASIYSKSDARIWRKTRFYAHHVRKLQEKMKNKKPKHQFERRWTDHLQTWE